MVRSAVLISLTFIIVSADVPKFVNYQGRLYENGTPVNETRAFGYKLYRDDNNNHTFDDGTDPIVWSQSPKFGNVNYGLFSDTLDFDDFLKYEPGETFSSVFGAGRDLFLRVYVNTSETWTGATALEPVEKFLATPFAFYAQTTISGGGSATQLADLTDVDDNITYTAGRLLIANGTDKYDDIAMSGDATINADGVIDLTNGAVETDEIADAAITTQKIYDSAVTTQKIAGSGNAALVSTGGTVSWSSPSSANTYLKWNGSSFTWDAGGASLPSLTNGRIWVGDEVNTPQERTVSGDATLSNTGVLDLVNSAVETDEIADGAVTTQKITGSGNAVLVSTGGSASWSSPGSANTYLKWDGSSFTWDAGGSGTGDNLGNHIATQRLDMSNYPIINVATPRTNLTSRDSVFGYAANINYLLGAPSMTSTTFKLYTYRGGSGGSGGGADNMGDHIARANIQLSSYWLSNDGGNEGIRIDNSGNVGIGTASPSYALDVSGSIRASGQLISSVATGTAPISVTSTTVCSNLNADLLDGQHGSYYAPATSISGTSNYIAKFTSSSAVGNSQIYDDGTNVGIGTTTPQGKLHILSSSGNSYLYLQASASGTEAILKLKTPTNREWEIKAAGNEIFVIRDNTAPADRISINLSGYVGIGTTTPSYQLDVNGTVNMTGFRMPTGASAGYVLTSDASGNGTWQPSGSTRTFWTTHHAIHGGKSYYTYGDYYFTITTDAPSSNVSYIYQKAATTTYPYVMGIPVPEVPDGSSITLLQIDFKFYTSTSVTVYYGASIDNLNWSSSSGAVSYTTLVNTSFTSAASTYYTRTWTGNQTITADNVLRVFFYTSSSGTGLRFYGVRCKWQVTY